MKNFTLKNLFLLVCFLFTFINSFAQSKATRTWDGSVDNDWQTAANWDSGIPTSTDAVIIPTGLTNYPIIDDGTTLAVCNDMTIQTGASVTIAYNGRLTVNGDLTNSAGNSGIVVESNVNGDGSLIVNTAVSATVKRYLAANSWEYLASPVTAAASTLFSAGEINYYNEGAEDYWTSDGVYHYVTTSGWLPFSGTLNVSSGYAFYDYTTNTITYTGTLNYTASTENISVAYTTHSGNAPNGVAYTALDGYNLLGNKYTSSLNWNSFTRTNVDNAVYYWNGTNYASWNGSTGTNGGTQYIPAQQGFYVKTSNTSGGTLSIPLSARTHDDKTFYKKETTENIIRIIADVNSITDETVINYVEGATNGFDGDYDVYKMFAPDINVPQVYSLAEGLTTGLAINSLPVVNITVSVPVGIRAADAAEVTFNITEINFPNADYIYLFDDFTDTYVDLLTTSTYQFTHTTGVVEDRFTLYIGVNEAPEIVNQISETETNEDEFFELNASAVFEDFDVLDEISYTAAIVIGKETPTWISFDNETQIFSGAPANEDVGVYDIVLKATDTFGAESYCSFQLTVNNVNDAPMVINTLGIVDVYEDTEFNIDVNGLIDDVDVDDVLTFSAELTDGSDIPEWITFNDETLIFTGLAQNENNGIYQILLKAKDIETDSAQLTFIIKVNNTNDIPQIVNDITDLSTNEDEEFLLDVSNVFEDVDIDDLFSLSAKLSDNSVLPEWLIFDSENNLFSGVPENENVGVYEIVLTAEDLNSGINQTTFVLTVLNTNDLPIVTGEIEDTTINTNEQWTYILSNDLFEDVDVDDVLTLSAMIDGDELPSWINFDNLSNTFTANPTTENIGTYAVQVIATDTESATNSIFFDLTVQEVINIDNNEFRNIVIYPNPTKDMIYISNIEGIKSISIFDLTGRNIYSQEINSSTDKIKIDLSSYIKGIYIINFKFDNKIEFYKVSVE